ncbi:unnamed protein product [Nezara viridula]|uniref:Uncharacterized protein n=1 Tax=Nezara viridula TaxID=85310 RepID=A0A9P0H0G0_NEZVI|nr:unnamed protein product [Nezara viridula]
MLHIVKPMFFFPLLFSNSIKLDIQPCLNCAVLMLHIVKPMFFFFLSCSQTTLN